MSKNQNHARSALAIDLVIGRKIRAARLEKGISQERLAEALGITFQQVQKYEKGVNRVAASRLHMIARAVGEPVTKFYPA